MIVAIVVYSSFFIFAKANVVTGGVVADPLGEGPSRNITQRALASYRAAQESGQSLARADHSPPAEPPGRSQPGETPPSANQIPGTAEANLSAQLKGIG